jgi:hypothetical protein
MTFRASLDKLGYVSHGKILNYIYRNPFFLFCFVFDSSVWGWGGLNLGPLFAWGQPQTVILLPTASPMARTTTPGLLV